MADINMGIGRLGDRDVIFKRKFRWTFEVQDICGLGGQIIPPHYVKLASRPNLTFDETEINYLHGKTFLPGKGTWETITVTYIDVATQDAEPLYRWLASVYEFNNPVSLRMGNRNNWGATGILSLYDGCGVEIEQWSMKNLWPQSINFGDLDYASSDEVTIELTLRYDQVAYANYCPGFTFEACCDGC